MSGVYGAQRASIPGATFGTPSPRPPARPQQRGWTLADRALVRTVLVATVVVLALLLGQGGIASAARHPERHVPSWIAHSCQSDVGGQLTRWIARQPSGSRLRFPKGACYRLGGDQGITIKGRSGLTLLGTGVTIRLRTNGDSNFSSAFLLEDSSHITVRGFKVIGDNRRTATTAAEEGVDEHINGAAIRSGNRYIVFRNVSFDKLPGFGVIISDDGDGPWPTHVTIRDSRIRGGEMGVAVTAGRHIDILRNRIDDTVYTAVDLEPDQPQHGFEDVLIKDNQIRRYGWAQDMTSWFVAACPADDVVDDVVMNGLTITGNRIYQGAATRDNGNYDGLGGLGIRIDKANLKTNLVITDNWSGDNDTQSRRAVIYLANVRDLRVTGNTQPISGSSKLVNDTRTTGTRMIRNNRT